MHICVSYKGEKADVIVRREQRHGAFWENVRLDWLCREAISFSLYQAVRFHQSLPLLELAVQKGVGMVWRPVGKRGGALPAGTPPRESRQGLWSRSPSASF